MARLQRRTASGIRCYCRMRRPCAWWAPRGQPTSMRAPGPVPAQSPRRLGALQGQCPLRALAQTLAMQEAAADLLRAARHTRRVGQRKPTQAGQGTLRGAGCGARRSLRAAPGAVRQWMPSGNARLGGQWRCRSCAAATRSFSCGRPARATPASPSRNLCWRSDAMPSGYQLCRAMHVGQHRVRVLMHGNGPHESCSV